MENNKKVYSQSIESILREHASREGTRNDDYDYRMKRSELRQPFYLADQKKPKKKGRIVKNIRIIMPIALIASLIAGGVLLVKHKLETKDVLNINNFSPTTGRDISISYNQKKAGDIIDPLTENNYDNLEYEDIQYVCDYIKNAELGNYDKNGSSIIFNLDDYFAHKAYFNKDKNYEEQSKLLETIGTKQKECFKNVDGKLEIVPENAKKFLDFTLSMIFMYDTTVDLRGSGLVSMNTQSVISPYATKEDVSAYQSLPLIIRYIIANQACTMLRHTNYHVDFVPSNYYGSLEKYDLIEKLQKEMNLLKNNMEDNVLLRPKSM